MNARFLTAALLVSGAVISTFVGGIFAFKYQNQRHYIVAFSSGSIIGIVFFDLLPESLALANRQYPAIVVTTTIAVGYFLFMLLNNAVSAYFDVATRRDDRNLTAALGAGSLAVHSFLDGVGIGLAFKVSSAVGLIVAAAVLAHDFSDGINTVSVVFKHKGADTLAMKWLAADAIAPFLGLWSTRLFILDRTHLGLILALFCGFFLFIGASDLLPDIHHQHPKPISGVLSVLGAVVIYLAVHFAQL